jgi:hypothetical protein
MATLTLSPVAKQTFFDDDGDIIPGGLLFTYAAGTSTKKNTYTDVGGLSANTNPIVLDSAGRVPSGFFLLPSSYKFILAPANDTDPPTNPVWSQDNVSSVPTTDVDNDITGTAGESVTAGQSVYLSDGSGAKIAGRWYLTDSALPYASTLPEVAFVVTAAAGGVTTTFRLSGRMTGLSTTAGMDYYLGATPGAITFTAPANARYVGRADSASSLIMTPNPRPAVLPSPPDGRLTLTTGVPVTVTDVTAATTVYFAPYHGNRFTQLSIAVPATTNQMYDVFVYDNAGTLALELTAWTNDTTRATELTTQNGVYVKTGALTRLYLGSFRTTGVSGQTEDSAAKRLVSNYYNQKARQLQKLITTDSYTYTTNTIRQWEGSTANQVEIVVGVAEDAFSLSALHSSNNPSADVSRRIGIGEGSTTAMLTTLRTGSAVVIAASAVQVHQASVVKVPAVGYQFYAGLEVSSATGTTTWYGDEGSASGIQSGLIGWILG